MASLSCNAGLRRRRGPSDCPGSHWQRSGPGSRSPTASSAQGLSISRPGRNGTAFAPLTPSRSVRSGEHRLRVGRYKGLFSSPFPLQPRRAASERAPAAAHRDSAATGKPLPQLFPTKRGERGKRAAARYSRAFLAQFVPCGVSVISTPIAASSFRMRSASAKFFALRAALRASTKACMRASSCWGGVTEGDGPCSSSKPKTRAISTRADRICAYCSRDGLGRLEACVLRTTMICRARWSIWLIATEVFRSAFMPSANDLKVVEGDN